jgi:hypothetical protein
MDDSRLITGREQTGVSDTPLLEDYVGDPRLVTGRETPTVPEESLAELDTRLGTVETTLDTLVSEPSGRVPALEALTGQGGPLQTSIEALQAVNTNDIIPHLSANNPHQTTLDNLEEEAIESGNALTTTKRLRAGMLGLVAVNSTAGLDAGGMAGAMVYDQSDDRLKTATFAAGWDGVVTDSQLAAQIGAALAGHTHSRSSLEIGGFLSVGGANYIDSPRYTATRTGNAIVTAGHDFQSGDAVFFEGTPPTPLVAGTRYYARDISATDFAVAATRGGAAITLSGATSGFTAAANWGADEKGTLVIGRGNKFANPAVGGYGAAVQVWGNENDINWLGIPETVGHQNKVSRPFVFGSNNTVRYNSYQGWFFIAGYDNAIQVGTSGGSTVCFGDQHLGGGHSVAFLGGFHNLANTIGTTDILGVGAAQGIAGAGTILVGAGGLNMQLTGAGVHAYWQGFSWHTSHANKDAGQFSGTLIYKSNTLGHQLAAGATRTDELLTMDYGHNATVDLATGVNTGTDTFTTRVNMSATNLQTDNPVWIGCNGTLPAPLVQDTVYYMDRLSDTTFKLKVAAGGATVDITNAGSGQFFIQPQGGNMRWLRLFPNKLYTFEVECKAVLASATTPTYAIYRRRVIVAQGPNNNAPTVLELVAPSVDLGSDNGAPPIGWSFNITTNTGGIHFSVTVKNTDGSSRHVTAYATVKGSEVNLL